MHILKLVMTLPALEILVCRNGRSWTRSFFPLKSISPLNWPLLGQRLVSYARQRPWLLLHRVEALVYKYESVLRSNISILSTMAQNKIIEWIPHSLHAASLMQMAAWRWVFALMNFKDTLPYLHDGDWGSILWDCLETCWHKFVLIPKFLVTMNHWLLLTSLQPHL